MTARIDGKKWVTLDIKEKGIYGIPVVWAGLHDDGRLTVEGTGFLNEGKHKRLVMLRIDLTASYKGTYDISEESVNEVNLDFIFPIKNFRSKDYQSNGTVTITKLVMKDGWRFVSGRFSFTLSNDEETVGVTCGRFAIPLSRIAPATPHPGADPNTPIPPIPK
jgi:hypothetical protein